MPLVEPLRSEPPSSNPELELLLHCARRELTADHALHVQRLSRSALDWDRLILLARRHNMLPLLYWHLKSRIELVPASSAKSMQAAFLENAARMLRFWGELLEVIRIFETHGLSSVPYKGPALSADLYGNLALRQSLDIDLLVARRHVAQARELLQARGYQPRHVLSESAKEFLVRGRYHEEFVSSDGISLELHWGFTNGDVHLPFDLDTLRPDLRTLRVGNGTVSMFGYADMLLILCVHGCKHRFDRLEWICGIAETLRADPHGIDWPTLVARATAFGVRRMLFLGLLLAHDLLEGPVPENVVEMARSDAAVARLASTVHTLLIEGPGQAGRAETLASDLFRLHLRERFRDRLRFVWYRLTTPSSPDSWYGVSIGARFVPLHAVLRPIRVLRKLLPLVVQSRFAGRAKP